MDLLALFSKTPGLKRSMEPRGHPYSRCRSSLATWGGVARPNILDPTSPTFEMADLETQARRQFLATRVILRVLTRFLNVPLTPSFPQNAPVPRHYLSELQRFLTEYPSDTNVSLTRPTRISMPTYFPCSPHQFTVRNSAGCEYSSSFDALCLYIYLAIYQMECLLAWRLGATVSKSL